MTQCISQLKRENTIPLEDSLVIAKFDILNTSISINEVEYRIFDKNGKELNISICQNTPVIISNTIIDDNALNYISGEYYSKLGINIYDSSDPYFNDICYTIRKNETKVTLNERRKSIYTPPPNCQPGCKYKSMNYTTHQMNCLCGNVEVDPQEKHFLNDGNEQAIDNIFSSTCWKSAFSSNLITNPGFLASASVLLIQTIIGLYYVFNGIKLVLTNFIKSNPNTPDSGDYFVINKLVPSQSTTNEIMKRITIPQQHKDFSKFETSTEDYYQYKRRKLKTVINSKEKDTNNRHFRRIFCSTISNYSLYFKPFYGKARFSFFGYQISMILFSFSLYLLINSLFISNIDVSHYIDGKSYFINLVMNSIYSCIIRFAIIRLVKHFILDIDHWLYYVNNNKEQQTIYFIQKYIDTLKSRFLLYYLIQFLVNILLVCYISIFCEVYQKGKIIVFISFFISILIGSLTFIFLVFLFSFLNQEESQHYKLSFYLKQIILL